MKAVIDNLKATPIREKPELPDDISEHEPALWLSNNRGRPTRFPIIENRKNCPLVNEKGKKR